MATDEEEVHLNPVDPSRLDICKDQKCAHKRNRFGPHKHYLVSAPDDELSFHSNGRIPQQGFAHLCSQNILEIDLTLLFSLAIMLAAPVLRDGEGNE